MRLLITGAGGMLGWEMARRFPNAHAADRSFLDITNEKSVREVLSRLKPDVVINCAAYTNVDGAETEREKAFLINAAAPELLARCAQEAGARLVHFSTDQVFDGKTDRPRTEDEPTHPLNYYAESKLAGERAVLRHPDSLVLRVQWLYGERKDRFSPIRGKEVFTPFDDQFGSPTWTYHLAEVVDELLRKQVTGLYHFAYDDFASWAEVYGFVKDEWKLSVRFEPKKTEEANLPAARPRFSVLSNKKLLGVMGWEKLGSWRDPLRKFLHGTA